MLFALSSIPHTHLLSGAHATAFLVRVELHPCKLVGTERLATVIISSSSGLGSSVLVAKCQGEEVRGEKVPQVQVMIQSFGQDHNLWSESQSFGQNHILAYRL